MNALVVTSSDKAFTVVVQTLRLCGEYSVARAKDVLSARPLIGRRGFSVAVVCADSRDAVWRELARALAENGSGTVYLPCAGTEDASAALCDVGVQLLTRPLTRGALYNALRTASGISARFASLVAENASLRDKFAAQKTISRAKCMLIQQGMSEQDAHKELEKRAMESRRTLLDVASDITEKGGTRIFVPSDERKTEE